MYRKDISRIARKAQEESGIDFDHIYAFLFTVLKTGAMTLKEIDRTMRTAPGVVYINEENNLKNVRRGVYSGGDSRRADYWEDRILERQERWQGD